MEVVELHDRQSIKAFSALMRMYNRYGVAYGFAASCVFVAVEEGYWIAGAILQPLSVFRRLFQRLGFSEDKRMCVIRRVARFCPDADLSVFLVKLARELCGEGVEQLVAFSDSENDFVLERAGFRRIGSTRNRKLVYLLRACS